MGWDAGQGPLRVAVIGAGPAGFYAVDALFKQTDIPVSVDMFDRLLTPFGLVRHGVAPDHLKIKTVTRAFTQTAGTPGFRFFGNVEFGRDLTVDDLRKHYHEVVFTTGAQTDRRMGIPGEDLARSHPATAFVAWYNGHPDYRDLEFDLQQESVAIVGVGNVAIDVARILCLSHEELLRTDMPDYAVEALSNSRVKDVYLVGRRGPAQAAFTNPELKELGELEVADVLIKPAEAELDPLSQQDLENANERMLATKVEMIAEYSRRAPQGRGKRLHLRFLVSPTELLDDGAGGVGGMTLVRNTLRRTGSGTLTAVATGETERIPVGLVFRSVGYRGVALPGVPFQERWGVISNFEGRVTDPETDAALPGEYVAGWIKRGPSGVIGTNKPDAVETVAAMLHDATAGLTWAPVAASPDSVSALLCSRGVRFTDFDDWRAIDAAELEAGATCSRPRVKFGSKAEMWACLGRERGRAAG